MIAELLEAFGNRLHPRFVVGFQLRLFFFFPSHFGTTYLSPSVNPRLLLSREGHRGLGALFEQRVSKLPLAPGDWARLLKGSTAQNKPDLERFHSPGAEHWGGQCHLPIAQVPGTAQLQWEQHGDTESSLLAPGERCAHQTHPFCLLQTQRIGRKIKFN